MNQAAPASLIIGCGFLGARLAARLTGRGQPVYATTRDQRRLPQLAALGLRPLLLSVTHPVTFTALAPALNAPSLDVYYMVPPGRPGNDPSPRNVVLGGIAHMVKQLRHAHVRRAALVSSTAVYAQRDGQRVDADSPAQPHDERGKLLRRGEQIWLDAGPQHRVLRLAGLYGPGRIVGLNAVRQGSPLVGDPDALLNLIHADDAADLLLALADTESAQPIELGCDGHPVARRTYYGYLAQLIGVPAPPLVDNDTAVQKLGINSDRLRRASSKALDNIPTCRRTGWSPRYPNYREGVPAAIAASRA